MDGIPHILNRLASEGPISYGAGEQVATEPTALAAIALMGHGRFDEAQPHLDWLAETQHPDGQVPVRRDPPRPGWTTALASLAWTIATVGNRNETEKNSSRFQRELQRAAAWMLSLEGEASPKQPQYGHDSSLVGWPWVESTHTWLEPTVFHVLALSARGWQTHARVVEGRRVILDRLLPSGGANYGNTVVLGQKLVPHVQPSGLALLGLAGAAISPKIRSTIAYLKAKLDDRTTPASLAWAAMGLASFGEGLGKAKSLLARSLTRTPLSSHHAALLALACLANRNPLISLSRYSPAELRGAA